MPQSFAELQNTDIHSLCRSIRQTLVQGQLTYCTRRQLLVHHWTKSRLQVHQCKAFRQHQMTPTATSSVAKFWSCWQMVEVQGRPLSQHCHRHNWNARWGQLYAQNWGQQVMLACTPRYALEALWKCFVDLPASEASHRSLYGNWKIGLGPTRESASSEKSDKFGLTRTDICIHAHMPQFPATQCFCFCLLSQDFFLLLYFFKEKTEWKRNKKMKYCIPWFVNF